MQKRLVRIFWLGCGVYLCLTWNWAAAVEKNPQIIGTAKCKMCHKSPKKGAQYTVWEKSGHARAYQVLASEKALAIAKEKGMDNPQQSAECLSCHTTGGTLAGTAVAASYDPAEGVGCESCHGPGSKYKKNSVMKNHEAALAAGLIIPDEKTCLKCHNKKSPTFTDFKFSERWAAIAHPRPKG